MARLGPWASPLPARCTSFPPLQLREGGPAQLGAPYLHLQIWAHRKFSLCPRAGGPGFCPAPMGTHVRSQSAHAGGLRAPAVGCSPLSQQVPASPLQLRRWIFFPLLHCCRLVGVSRGDGVLVSSWQGEEAVPLLHLRAVHTWGRQGLDVSGLVVFEDFWVPAVCDGAAQAGLGAPVGHWGSSRPGVTRLQGFSPQGTVPPPRWF